MLFESSVKRVNHICYALWLLCGLLCNQYWRPAPAFIISPFCWVQNTCIAMVSFSLKSFIKMSFRVCQLFDLLSRLQNKSSRQFTSRQAESRHGSFCVAHLLHASWALTGEPCDHHCWFLVNVPLHFRAISLRWPLGYQRLQILRCENIAEGVAEQPTPVLRGFSMPLCPRCAQPCIVHSA